MKDKPVPSIEYLTLIEVLEMHYQLIERYGGSHGIREPGALDSALMRPQLGYYSSVLEQAAALMESLAKNHPFIDGNKRISFAATLVFLKMNGYQIEGNSEHIYQKLMTLFERQEFDFVHLVEWLKESVRAV